MKKVITKLEKELKTMNPWEIKGFCYWESELSFDNDLIWINIGWSGPLVANKNNFQHVVGVSAWNYIRKFN